MDSEQKSPTNSAPEASNSSVQDLIYGLQSTFFAVEFRKVVDVLTEREEQMKKQLMELEEKVKCVEQGKDYMLLEVLRLKDELAKKNKEKGKMEAELRAYEKRFAELDSRVLRLEKTSQMLEEGGSYKVNESKFPDIIQIVDDEEPISTLKRKRVSSELKRECNSDDGNVMPTGMEKMKNLQESHHQPKASHPFSTPHSVGNRPCLEKLELKNLRSSHSSSDSDDEDVDVPYNSIITGMQRQNERWKFEADMIKEFENDDLLCIDAICALHRRILKGKPMSFGADSYDKSRVAELATMLIDGDPHLKLKKVVSRLERSDLDDCRKFAIKFSNQLFYIYKTKEDPFFPSSKVTNPKISAA